MIEKIDEDTNLAYSYEDGGYFFIKRQWKVCAEGYTTKKKAMAAYNKEKREKGDRKELGEI
jgi:hypothetical protein